MAFIDGMVVNLALPALQKDLAASFTHVQWVVSAYALCLGALILFGGVAGDAFGRRRVFLIGVNLFALASVLCAAAPNANWLIAARALQGVGAALMVPQSLALIAAHFPQETRGRAIGLWAGASAMATALGPPLGGVLIDLLGWPSVFWINFPICMAILYVSHRFIPEEAPHARPHKMDWGGALLAVVGIGGLTLALSLGAENGGALMTLLVAGAGLGALLLFWRLQRRSEKPLIPAVLFENRLFVAANGITVLLYGALAVVLFLLPFELIDRRQLGASLVGLAILPMGVIIGLLSRPAGRWADRAGPRMPVALGAFLVSLAVLWLTVNWEAFWGGLVAPIVLMAVGMGLVVSPLTTAVMNAAPEIYAGAASGVNNAASRLAGLLGIVVVGTIANYVFVQELALVGLGDGAFFGAKVHMGDLPPPGAAARSVIEVAFNRAYGVGMILAFSSTLAAAIWAYVGLPKDPPETA